MSVKKKKAATRVFDYSVNIESLDPEEQEAMLTEMTRSIEEGEEEDELEEEEEDELEEEEEDELEEEEVKAAVPDATSDLDSWSIYIGRPLGTPKYQQMLDTAGEHFLAHGYASVRIHDIAAKLGKKHSAIYYYAPEGKEQLYMLVMERLLKQHFSGIHMAIQSANSEIYSQLQDIAMWLLDMRPISPIRIETLDFPELRPENIRKMRAWIHKALVNPIESLLLTAIANEQIELPDPSQAAAVFIEVIYAQRWHSADDEDMIMQAINMLLYGWTKR